MKKSLQRILVLFVLLTFMLVLLVPWKRVEDFATQKSSIELYQQSDNHRQFMKRYDRKLKEGLLQDRERLLHMRGCYQFQKHQLNMVREFNKLSKNHKYKVERIGPMYTKSFSDIESKVKQNIIKVTNELRAVTKKPNAVLTGEIYVMVFQAPYYRTKGGSMMSVQFNIDDYGFMPINVGSATSDVAALNTPLDFDVYVVYANYAKNMALRRHPWLVDNELMPFRSNHELCKVRCAKSPDMICGCKTGEKPPQHYRSKCVAAPMNATTIEQKNNAIPHDFPILYVVNRQNRDVLNFMSQAMPKRRY